MGLDQGLLCDLKGIVGSAEVPPALVCMRPHQEGNVAKESVGKAPVGLSVALDCSESLLRQWAQRTVCSTV